VTNSHDAAFDSHAMLHQLALFMLMVGVNLGAIMLLLMCLRKHQMDEP
jgi:hypothetical protein